MRADSEKVEPADRERGSSWGGRIGSPWVLALLAVAYYSLYFRSGFNLPDEGSVALLSQRILQGERPFTDLALGYNVLWFYPIVGLFAVFGVNLVVMKIYFFGLTTAKALLGYGIVRKVTKCQPLAFCAGLILVLIPSASYRTYIPLGVIANTACLLLAIDPAPRGRKCARFALGGIVLGLTFLTRIDLGIFFSVIWIGVSVLILVAGRSRFGHEAGTLLLAAMLLVSAVVAVHAPVYIDAQRRGFGDAFIGQYRFISRFLVNSISPRPLKVVPANRTSQTTPDAGTPLASEVAASRDILGRRELSEIWRAKHFKRKALPFLTYAPLLSLGALLALSSWTFAVGAVARKPGSFHRWLSQTILAGGSLTAFPQFFFFRPDVPHLAEFMSGLVLVAFCGGFETWRTLRMCRWGVKSGAAFILAFLAIHIAVWIGFAMPQRSAGTIVARFGCTALFRAENGVSIYLTPEEFAGYTVIKDTVMAHAAPKEVVLCYPYAPGINFMTNRPTSEHSLYVDNATRPHDFDDRTIATIEARKPAAIVISDWDVNGHEGSRFRNWAPKAMAYIRSNYALSGAALGYEIYTRTNAFRPISAQGAAP
jgi:hypothetical protein